MPIKYFYYNYLLFLFLLLLIIIATKLLVSSINAFAKYTVSSIKKVFLTIEISCLKTVRILPILGFPKLLVGIFCDSSDSLFYSCSFVRHSYVNGWISLFGRAQLRTGLVLTVTDVLTS